MQHLLLFGTIFVIIAFIVWRWVAGIDYMKENHSDYKGDDFLHTSSGRDLWDEYNEDCIHTEGEF